jgi:hypothetical protein
MFPVESVPDTLLARGGRSSTFWRGTKLPQPPVEATHWWPGFVTGIFYREIAGIFEAFPGLHRLYGEAILHALGFTPRTRLGTLLTVDLVNL